MTSNPTAYKRQVTFNRGLINFPDFTELLLRASSQFKCRDVVLRCVFADICMCISPSLIQVYICDCKLEDKKGG